MNAGAMGYTEAPVRAAMPRRRVLLMLALSLCASPPTSAASDSPIAAGEYEVKAAYLCKFGSYIEWPAPDARAAASAAESVPFVIGVMAPEEVFATINAVAARQTVSGRPLHIRRVKAGEQIGDVSIVFITRGNAQHASRALSTLRGRAVLTVTENPPDTADSGMVNFLVVQDRVKFDVALASVQDAGLKISSRLLNLAHAVVRGSP